MDVPSHQMGGGHGDTPCCMPTMGLDCGMDNADELALVSPPLRMGPPARQIQRVNVAAQTASSTWAGRCAAPDPFMSILLSRTTAPIYLQTAVFLC